MRSPNSVQRLSMKPVRDPEETRRRILRAAAEAFYGKGIRNVSMDDVAEGAGVTKRTLYYHYKDKDDLVATYLRARHPVILARLVAAATQAKGPLPAQLNALFSALSKSAGNHDWKGCMFARVAAELAGTPDHPAFKEVANHKAEFELWLRDRVAAAGYVKPGLLAKQLIVLFDGAVTHMLIRRDPAYALAAGKAAMSLLQATTGKRRK